MYYEKINGVHLLVPQCWFRSKHTGYTKIKVILESLLTTEISMKNDDYYHDFQHTTQEHRFVVALPSTQSPETEYIAL